MEELLKRYTALIRLLEEEEEKIGLSIDGELRDLYCTVLRAERQDAEKNLVSLQKYLR